MQNPKPPHRTLDISLLQHCQVQFQISGSLGTWPNAFPRSSPKIENRIDGSSPWGPTHLKISITPVRISGESQHIFMKSLWSGLSLSTRPLEFPQISLLTDRITPIYNGLSRKQSLEAKWLRPIWVRSAWRTERFVRICSKIWAWSTLFVRYR